MPQIVFAETSPGSENYNLQELTFPAEVKDIQKQVGSVYYSAPIKNKVLVPIHIWGEVGRPGLHFIPVDSSLIKGLSLAGGPTGSADLGNIYLVRKEADHNRRYEFDLEDGGKSSDHDFVLKPGDSVFIQKDHFFENRFYYTSLVSIGISILTGILLYDRIQNL